MKTEQRAVVSATLASALLAAAPFATPRPLGAQAQTTQSANDRLRAAETALEKNDLKTAAGLLKDLAEERPGDAHVLYDLGYAEEGLEDSVAAKQAYTAAVAADPAYGEAHVALGLLLARTGSPNGTEAQAQLRAGADSTGTPAEVRGRALRALAALEQSGRPTQASDDLLQAVKLTHETEPDVVLSADLALTAGSTAEAEQAYRRALQLEPDDATAATGLARALRRENRLADADAVLSAALAKHPNDAQVLSALAAVKGGENKTAEAIALLEPLMPPGSATKNPALAQELARLYSMTDQKPKAEAIYAELVAKEPADPALLDDYGDVLVREAKFAQAEAVLQRAVAKREAWSNPRDWAEAAGHLAFAASRNHDPRGTLQAIAARVTVLPNSPSTLFLEAAAHDSLHQTREAIQAYRAFLAMADGKFPDEEFETRHRLVALEHTK